MGDARTGDTGFDEAFAIKTSDPQQLAARLSPASRHVLLELVKDYRSVKITDERLSYEKNGIERDAGALVTTAQRLVEGARALQGVSPEQSRPEPDAALPIREVIPPPPPVLRPDPFDTQPPVFEPTLPERPVDTEARPEPLTPESPAPTPSGLTAVQVADELFARKGLSFQIAKLFEEKYQDNPIDWPGEVREVVTGIGPNDPTRITVLVTTVEHELFGSVDVEAVASVAGRVPRGLAEGRQISLRGTLTGIDAMSRRLLVEDARIAELHRPRPHQNQRTG
jgi:hypothetical protein